MIHLYHKVSHLSNRPEPRLQKNLREHQKTPTTPINSLERAIAEAYADGRSGDTH
jgi:hypothetical protein